MSLVIGSLLTLTAIFAWLACEENARRIEIEELAALIEGLEIRNCAAGL